MIRVSAAPDSIDATPGQPVAVTLTIANTDAAARACALRLVGVDPRWVAWPESLPVADGAPGPVLRLEANESVELPVVITLPPGFPAGAQLIGIEAAIEGVARPALGSLQLSVADIDGVRFSLSPASFRGGRSGRFRINVANRGRDPITIDVSGRPAGDDPGELKFEFKPKQLTLRTDERARIKGRVTGKRPIVGAPRIRPMTIVAQSNSAPLHADARFTQRPLLSRRVMRVFAIFIALSMWAGALVTAVRWNGDRREETAAEASAETAIEDTTTTTLGPGESVMVDTDGDGEPDTEMVDTDGDGQPDTPAAEVLEPGEEGLPSGPVLSGQVTGVADRSNITVSGRYVALAQAIPADADEEELAAQGVGDGTKGKVFASALTTVDTDDPAKSPRSTVTDENGFWKLAGLAEGNWELTFTKDGFGTRTLVVPVEEGVEPEPIEVAMAAGDGTIGGLVSTESGPVGGALITVTDGAITFTTTTPTEGDIGRWQIGGLSTPGTYLVTAELRGFGTETASVTLDPSGSNLDVAQTLVSGVGSISGIVTGGGDGLGGIVVTAASDTVTRSVTTLTEPAGTFTLPQLPIPGDYTLTISGANWVPQTQIVELEGNVEDLAFELLATTALIRGVVTGPDGGIDAVGITVSQDEPLVKALSASGGNYEVIGLLPGTYTVTFELFGFETQSTIVELAVGDETEVNMTLEATPEAAKAGDATVQGIVRSGTTGQPVTGVAVAFQGKSVTSAEGGTFTIEGLAAGTGDLVLSHAMYQSTSRTVRLGVKAVVQVDITMLPLGGLQGQITDLTATPISGVSVTVAAQTGTAAVTVPTATSDANGEYSILQSFPTGSYIATFSKTGYGTQTREFEAAAGSNSVADIQLVELGTITGGLQEPGGGVGGFLSLSNVTVKVEKLVNGAVSGAPVFGPVVRNGSYTVSGLEAGSYRVTATHPDFPDPGVRDLLDLKLREVRDGGIVLARGAAAVAGQVYFSTGTGRQGVIGATITAQVVTGYTILPTFPFVSPLLQSVSTSSVAQGTLVDADDDGAVDDAAPSDGYFVIDPQPVSGSIANYTVAATGFTTRIQAITSPTAGGSGDIVLIPNPKDLTGTVTFSDADVNDVVVAKLSSSVLSEDITLPTLTNNGSGVSSFAFNDLAPGDYTVTFTSADYHTNTDTITITNVSPDTVAMGDTVLDRESSLEITVRTNNGAGALVAAASVTITQISGGSATQTKLTNATGEALFTELRAGTYRVGVTRTGFESATSAAAATGTMIADIPLAVGQNRADTATELVTLQRHPDVTVNVTGILANLTGDGSTTTALANANVTLTPTAGGSVVNLLHGAGGAYTATLVPPATYRLDVTSASHDAFSQSPITVSAGPNVTLSAQLNKFASLVVYLDKTIGGLTTDFSDADHTATPATITATPTAGGSPITLTKCAAVPVLPCPVANPAVGTWVANNVPAGTYSVVASASGYASQTVEISGIVAGSTFSNATTPVLALTKFATLTVNVTKDPDGGGVAVSAPIAATTVTATRTDGTVLPMAATATVGTYQVTSITPGTYNISVALTDHVTGTSNGVVVGSGSSPTVTVDLISLPDAAVTVVDNVAANVTNAVVLATPSGGGTPISFSHDGGTPGTYRASKVPTGSYTLSVSAPGFATFTGVSGNLVSTTSGTITGTTAVTLTIAASIRVTVYDNVNTPGVTELDGALVVIRAAGGTNPTSRVRFSGDDGDGLAEFDEMTPTAGFTYSLTVSKAGYATHEQTGITLSSGGSPAIDVVLEPLAIISFSITGSPGSAAITNATVTATQGTTQLTAVPLFSGVYVFPGLAAGDWSIAVAAPNHGTYPSATTFASLAALDSTDALAVADGNVVAGENRTYALSLAAWPTQSVTVDSDGGAGFVAVSGALVTATPLTGSGTAYVLTETATAGTYTSPPLQPGIDYTLSATKPDHTLTATTTTGAVVAGVALGTVPNLILGRNPTQSIEVKEVVNGAAAAVSSGATVTATRVGGPTYTLTETSTAGTYISPPLTPGGAYTITATKAGHTLTLGPRTTAAVVAGTTLSAMTTAGGAGLQLSAIPSLSVTVIGGFDDAAEDDDVDPDMTAAGGDNATVTATSADGSHVVTLSRTGVGTYSTSALNASVVYTVSATKAGYTIDLTPAVATFTATPGGANGTRNVRLGQHPNLQVDAIAGLVGGLTDTNADTGVTFTLTPIAPEGSTLTLENETTAGRYSFNGITPGSYTLLGTKANHTTTGQTVTAEAGRELATISNYQLLLYPTLTVSLSSTTPVADVNDAVVTATNVLTGDVIGLEFSATGDYEATLVPPATYDILATGSANHGDGTSNNVIVAPGTNNTTSINVPRYGTLTVSVNSSEDPDGAGVTVPTLTELNTATVTATNTTTGAVSSLPSIGSGDYAASLPAGTYSIAASAGGHDSGTAANAAISNAASASRTIDLLDWPDLVVDVDGLLGGVQTALGGATVTATPTAGGAAITIVESGTTGVHSLLSVTPGGYTVTASKAGYEPVSGTVTAVAGERLSVVATAGTHIERNLPQHPTLTVSLTSDETGTPDIDDATVLATHPTSGAVIALAAIGSGDYRAASVPPGAYTLSISAPNHATQTGVALNGAGGASVVAGTNHTSTTVALSEAAELVVHLHSVVTSVPTDDDPLSGATVTATNSATGDVYPLGPVAGTPGDYRAQDLPVGTYTATATATGHATATSGGTAISAASDGSVTLNLPRYPDLTVLVQGTTAGVTAALSGATVTAIRTVGTGGGPAVVLGETATAGTYQTLSLPPGDYTVSATKSGYTTAALGATVTSAAGTALPASSGTITITQGTLVRVTVNSENDLDGAGAIAATLSELATATVTLDGTGTNDLVLNHVAGGTYELTVTTADTYVFTVDAPGHTRKSGAGDGIANVVLSLGAARVDRSVNLAAIGGIVGGTIVNLTNGVLPGVDVTATNGLATVGPVTSIAGGLYSFTGANALEPGVWSLKFDDDDLAPLTISVNVPHGTVGGASAAGATVDVDVTLAPAGGAINGQTLIKASALDVSIGNPAEPLAGTVVTLFESDGTTEIDSVTPDETTGFWFGFGGLDNGTYDLEFDRPSGTDFTVDNLTVGGGEIVTRSHVFTAAEVNAVITTSLADGVTDVNDVNVTLTNPALISPAETQESDGTTTFVVPYGTYTMTVTQPSGYVSIDPISRTIVVLPTGTTNIDHRYSAIGTISGTTMQNDDATATTLLATYDEVVSGVTVTVSHANGYRQEATSGPDGTYSMSVPIGTAYTVTFEKDGYVTDSVTGQTVVVDTNLATTAGDLDVDGGLDKLASFLINVVDQAAAGLSGVTVTLFQDDAASLPVTAYLGGTGITSVDADTFQVTGLDPTVADKILNIRGSVAGYFQVVDPGVTLIAGDNGTRTLTLVQDADLTIDSVGIAGGDDLEITLNWTRLGVAASSGPHAFDNSNAAINVLGLPAGVAITATKTLETGFSVACAITTGPGGDLDGTFTLVAGSTNDLIYTCVS